MSKYAEGTEVPVSKSRTEIESLLKKRGVVQHFFGETLEGARIMFILHGRMYRFDIPYPDPEDREYSRDSHGWLLSDAKAKLKLDAEIRRRWRIMIIRLKVKFETVDDREGSLDEEFLANLILPDGSTMSEYMEPKIEEIYATGKMPDTLPGLEQRVLPQNIDAEVVG
jgi:hypothetical protein